MWKSRKFIALVVVVAVILVGSVAGVVYAQENGDEEEVSPRIALLERVADKLGIDAQQLKDAFAEAIDEMQAEIHVQWLEKAVEEGLITEEDAAAYSEWWSARPDVDFGLGGLGPRGPLGFGGLRMRGGCGVWHVPDSALE
jgi:hypothetical protein